MTTSPESIKNETTAPISTVASKQTIDSASSATESNEIDDSSVANRCVLCLTEEKRIACSPCGHLCACVPCGHSLRLCPICRREIEAFVRVYI